jgi:hypothetical protein
MSISPSNTANGRGLPCAQGQPALQLDPEDIALLREAENNSNAFVTDTPDDQKLGTISVVCLIMNRMIGERIIRQRCRQTNPIIL